VSLRNAALGISLALASSTFDIWAQTGQTAPTPPTESTGVVRTFYLTNVSRTEDGNEIVAALRNLLDPNDRMLFVPSQNAIVLRGAPDQIPLAQKLLTELDKPKKTYRLTYTITDLDGAKRIGTQHFAVIVVAGGRTVLKQGSRVPIATGTFTPGASGSQTQFTYLDIGLNIDASLDEAAEGVRLRTKVEQSGIAGEKSSLGEQDPIVRQTQIEGTSILTPGKPLILGSIDIPGTTRHLDIEVNLEVVH